MCRAEAFGILLDHHAPQVEPVRNPAGPERRVHVHRLGQVPAVEPHPAPVRHAVNPVVVVQPELRPHLGKCLVDDAGAAVAEQEVHWLVRGETAFVD